MAKPRKHKSEEHAPESSGGVVLHQKLCLSIDMEKRVIYGHTEMQVSISEGGYIALHADNMTIRSVSVDGEPAEFEFIPYYQVFEEEKRWGSVSCSTSAADVACSTYLSSLEDEMVPNLLIACHKSTNSMNDQQGQHNQSNGGDVLPNSFGEHVNGYDGPRLNKNVKLVCIDYMVDRAETGIHFWNNVLITDNQIRRAHCWFPCMDSTMQCCTFDLEITVNLDFVAISNGSLLYQVLSKDDPPRKTYVYQLSVPVSVGWISLAVAPFEILPDGHNGIITHMCLSPNLSKLQNTVGFFHNAFSHYEDYLSMSFPFGSYKQVFIPPEISVSSINMGASMCIFSSELLFDEKVIDQTINTRIKLAHALARQWFGVYIVAEELNDEWLLDGLAGYLTDSFTKRFLGNNEARYRRHKANCAVCKADVSGATALSSAAATTDLYGTQSIGLYGKIRSWKATAILQMLEKQMGPDSFRKILQNIVHKPVDTTRSVRTLSTKEFRHLANKIGNLERPFLKEFFPRWVESCGCPVMRMGISYNKRRNMIELAVIRDCTAKLGPISTGNLDSETRDGDTGWPGMMSIRVHELDGMYDHPSLPMAGDAWQLLEIQCHSKLAAKRIQKLRKGSKPDGSDDNADATSTMDMRNGMDSPLLWIRVDPEMEYLAEIHLHQPIQMLVNQLEKDKDVVAQAEAIASLEDQPQFSFSIVNALNNFLCDQKGFWRVRIEAAYALARTASEETDLTGLHNLVKFYKTRRFDEDIGLPRPNDFHDVPEYFVLEAIPHAISLVRTSDKKSPREAVEFVLQLLKYNDNNGNPYSDVYWLAALVLSIGELEFCQQSILLLPSLLKRIDRLLQFDCLIPSYNGILTISCIRTLAQIALKLSSSVPVDHVCQLIKPFRETEKTKWKVRIEASRALLDLEFYHKGVNAALSLFMNFLADEPSFRGEVKLAMHVTHLCQLNVDSELGIDLDCPTQVALLRLLASRKAFNNVFLRHHLFCIFQIIAGRSPTLFGVQRIPAQSMVTSEFYINHIKPALLKLGIIKPQEHVADAPSLFDGSLIAKSAKDPDTVSNCSERSSILKLKISRPQEPPADASHLANAPSDMEAVKDNDAVSNCSEKTTSLKLRISGPQGLLTETRHPPDAEPVPEVIKDTDTVSICSEKKVNILKIKVKQPSSSSKADDADHTKDHSQGGQTEAELGPCSSMSVDAPTRVGDNEPLHANNMNIEEVNSSHDQESRMSASIGCAKLVNIDEVGKELQCTADSRNVATHEDRLSPNSDVNEGAAAAQENSHLQEPTHLAHDLDEPIAVIDRQEGGEEKKSKKEKERKRKRDDKSSDRKPLDDPAYLEHKRQKKEKKRLEKELAKKLKREAKASLDLQKSASSVDLKENPFCGDLEKAEETTEPNAPKSGEIKAEALQASFTTKFKIKLKGKIIGGS